MFTTGWSTFVISKRLVAGVNFLFLRTSLFVVSVNKSLETINQILSAGIMFKMRFEGVDSRDRQKGCYLCLDSKYFSFWSGNGNLNMLIQSKTNCISQFIYYSGRVHGGANSEGTVGNTQRDMQLLSLNFLSYAKLRTHLFEV